MILQLEQLYKRKETSRIRFRSVKTLRLPLYFDRNSSCIHVGARNRDISELNLGLPPQPTGDGEQTSSDDGGDSEVDLGMDSEVSF